MWWSHSRERTTTKKGRPNNNSTDKKSKTNQTKLKPYDGFQEAVLSSPFDYNFYARDTNKTHIARACTLILFAHFYYHFQYDFI